MFSEQTELDFSRVKKGSVRQSKQVPSRPNYLALNVGKGERNLGIRFPTSKETIKKLVRDVKTRVQEVAHVANSS